MLYAKERRRFVAEAFNRFVIQIRMADFDIVAAERISVDSEAVILRSDFDFTGIFIHDGLVPASVSEFEFIGVAAECVGQHLVSEADAEDGHLFFDKALDGRVEVFEGCWIARAVG